MMVQDHFRLFTSTRSTLNIGNIKERIALVEYESAFPLQSSMTRLNLGAFSYNAHVQFSTFFESPVLGAIRLEGP